MTSEELRLIAVERAVEHVRECRARVKETEANVTHAAESHDRAIGFHHAMLRELEAALYVLRGILGASDE